MKRSELAIIVTVIDIFCVIIFILGYYFLAKNSEAALMEYKELKVDMKEFAVEVSGLPERNEYKNEKLLKA